MSAISPTPSPRFALTHPVKALMAREGTLRRIGARASLEAAAVLGAWSAFSVALGLTLGAGQVVSSLWLTIVSVAIAASPISVLLLRKVNERRRMRRLALAAGDDPLSVEHLTPGLRALYGQTRVIRLSLSETAGTDEGIRLLQDWRETLRALDGESRERVSTLGIMGAPIDRILAHVERRWRLDASSRLEAETFLASVEHTLAGNSSRIYR